MKSNADKHEMKSAAKREPHEYHDHHAHMAADFRKGFWILLVPTLPILVLSPFMQKPVGSREAIGFAGDLYVLFGLSIAVVFLWWLAVSQWAVRRACLAPARDDDTSRCCHHYGLCLHQRRAVWPDRHDVVLGFDYPRRHHVAGTLDRDEVGDACLDGPGGTGRAHALGCPQFSCPTAV